MLTKKNLASTFLKGKRRGDKIFRGIVIAASSYSALMLILVAFAVGEGALPIFSQEGFQFVIGTDWNAVYGRESFGALPYIIGTLLQLRHCDGYRRSNKPWDSHFCHRDGIS